MANTTKHHNYDVVEKAWRAGVVSVRQLAKDYTEETGKKITPTSINKHFVKLGIPRDLKKKVQEKASALVSAAMVSGSVSIGTTATDADIINTEAKSVAEVQFGHRIDIPRKRELVAKLFDELEATTDGKSILDGLVKALKANDVDRLATTASKVASLPGRIKGVTDLVSAYKSLINLERQAFNITDGSEGDKESIKLYLSKEDVLL